MILYKKRGECEKTHGHIKDTMKFDIRRIRKEAEEQVARLKKEIGVAEPEEDKQVDKEVTEEEERECGKCSKDLSDLPEDIAVCPYCGTSLQETDERSGSIFTRLKRPSED